jgi:hypothetical protein
VCAKCQGRTAKPYEEKLKLGKWAQLVRMKKAFPWQIHSVSRGGLAITLQLPPALYAPGFEALVPRSEVTAIETNTKGVDTRLKYSGFPSQEHGIGLVFRLIIAKSALRRSQSYRIISSSSARRRRIDGAHFQQVQHIDSKYTPMYR